MMHRIFLIFLPVVAALALTLAPVSAEAAGGGGGQGGLGTSFGAVGGGRGSLGANPGAGGIGHGSFTGNLGSGSIGHGGASLSPGSHGSIGHLDVGHGDNGHVDVGLGSNRAPIGLGLNRGIGSPDGDDIHLGLSRELGLGNNFGLNPDNLLSRAARLPNSSNPPDLGAHTNDRPPLQGLNTNKDSAQSPQRANNSPAGADAKVQNFKNEEVQARRSVAIEEEELLQQEAKLQANLPQAPPPPTASPTTAPSIAQPAPTLPEDSTVVTTSLGSGEVSMIGAYFAEHGAPVASVPTSSVNVSVGGTIPENVALFPPPYDLANQVSDADFLYFVWGQSVVIVDGQTNVVTGIIAVPADAQSTEAPGAKSDITIAADTTPSTSGVENSAAGEGASNMNTPDVPATRSGSANAGGPNSEDQGGTGVKGSAQSEGATNKNSAINPSSGAGSSQTGGPSTGLEPGTGIEDSAQGEGATAKQGKPDMKEGKLPSPSSTY